MSRRDTTRFLAEHRAAIIERATAALEEGDREAYRSRWP
jgi:hypothetical protein